MNHEERTVIFDPDLQLEAYRFNGIKQKFPNHFHEYYVIGFVQKGLRKMTCKNREYIIEPGDLVIFNPGENHSCFQVGSEAFDWRCLNIPKPVMLNTASDIIPGSELPCFSTNVVRQSALIPDLEQLHDLILNKCCDMKKEQLFYFLMEALISDFTGSSETSLSKTSAEIQAACDYMNANYMNSISLGTLSDISGLKKYTLLRHFVRQCGITPYQYLETTRVNAAKQLLETGVSPMDSALQAGFTDQSHFTHFFKNYIGVTPGQYQNIFR